MTRAPHPPDAAPQSRPRSGERSRERLPGRFGRDRSGATAVEFGIVALPFLTIMIGIIEVAVDYLIFSRIDYATHKAAQEIRFGAVQANNMSAERFKSDVLCPKIGLLSCSSVVVNAVVVRSRGEFDQWLMSTINPATAKWCPGNAADFVLLQVAYPVPLATMIWAGARSNANGVRYYLSAASFRNDAFGLATSRAGC